MSGVNRLKIKAIALALALTFTAFAAGACAKPKSPANPAAAANKGKNAAAPAAEKPVFTCTSAGRWYPNNPAELRDMIDGYLAKAQKENIAGRIDAVIAPHAGYQYSAPVAAYAYKQLQGLRFDAVVVIGFSHGKYDSGIAVFKEGSFRTPLGDIPIDSDMTGALIAANPNIKHNPELFTGEHSLDNQLPFLQRVLPGFKLVPVLFGSQTAENINILADALAKVLKGKNVLLVASTDMSHFWQQDEANKLDAEMISHVRLLDAAGIARLMQDDPSGRRLCGYGAVQAVIRAAKALGADEARILKHATSQDTFGPTGNGVVGYMAAVLTDKKGKNQKVESKTVKSAANAPAPDKEKKMKPQFPGDLDEASQKELLKIARKALEAYILTGSPFKPDTSNRQLDKKHGVFVTLNENGMLRGCMGWFEADTPLKDIVARQAVVSATQDPRFPRVRPDELPKIDIEISVLSEPKYVDSYDDIEVGKHGVILEKGYNRATFLPQVAPEQGWDRDTMLSNLAMKAGLSPDAWKQGCRFQVYTAQVFGEKE
ncbi:MAG: AmmeMemoRadiSam system protein B [bacterium]